MVVAGPNGAGKTTFAREYLPNDVRVLNFVNADLIAGGLSPLKPELAAIAAGRLVLKEVDRLVEQRADFAFESTLSGVGYVSRLRQMKQSGYHIEIIYLKIVSLRLAVNRINSRVRQGGHNVPNSDVRRRFTRSWQNFENHYRPLADAWAIYDNSTRPPKLIGSGP
ncbi:MAG: zeta toxin family protein [Pseudomonas fluorescens]